MKALHHPLLLVSFCSLIALSAQAAEKDLEMSQPTVQQVPAEVAALADRAAACRRWSNTEITDQADDTLVDKELATLKCNSLEGDLATLQQKYRASKAALKAIEAMRSQGF